MDGNRVVAPVDDQKPDPTKDGPGGTMSVQPSSLPGKDTVRFQAEEGESKETPPAPDPNRPAWLPENFKTPEDLVASYKELQKKSTPASGKPAVSAEAPPLAEKAEPSAPVVKSEETKKYELDTYGPFVASILDKAGIDAKSMSDGWYADGKVNEDTYVKFENAGITRGVLDSYLQGQSGKKTEAQVRAQVHGEAAITAIKEVAGGPERFDLVAAWAKANMSAEDVEAYNAMVDGQNVTVAKRAVAWITSEYTRANGTEPVLQTADVTPRGGDVAGYASTQEMMVDMRDPRYKSGDPAFHRKVEDKLKRSSIL